MFLMLKQKFGQTFHSGLSFKYFSASGREDTGESQSHIRVGHLPAGISARVTCQRQRFARPSLLMHFNTSDDTTICCLSRW